MLVAGAMLTRAGDAQSPLEITAASAVEKVAPTWLVTRATLRNVGTEPLRIEYSFCTVDVWAFRTVARSGRPVWRSEFRMPPKTMGTETGYGCPQPRYVRELAPGASIDSSFALWAPTYEVLADSLPEGRYFLSARVHVNGQVITVPAGDVALVRAQAPLPASRSLGLVRFDGASRVVRSSAGDSLEVTLRVTNADSVAHALAEDRTYGGCHVEVAGFRDVARRDAYYLYRDPDWNPTACAFTIATTTLAPGQSMTLRGAVAAPRERVHLALLVSLLVDRTAYRPDVAVGSAP